MIAPRKMVQLLAADALNVSRDPILLAAMVISILPAILLLAFGQAAEAGAQTAWGVSGMASVLGALAVVVPGAMIGWVTGFLLLEDRDEAMLLALEITPIGKTGFIAYRLAVCAVLVVALSTATALATLPIGPFTALAMGLVAAAHGLAGALFLLAFAANKVEGLALTKLVNLALFAPLVVLWQGPLRYLGAPLPPFWIGEMAGLGANPLHPAFALVAAMLVSALWIGAFWRRVRKTLG